MILFALLVSTVVAAQVAGPGLFGPTADHLTGNDVRQITALFREAGSPWLMYGDSPHWMPGWSVLVYFSPDHVSGRVRRGRLAHAIAPLAARGNYVGRHVWSVLASRRVERYAQVSVPGTDPTTLTRSRDLNRPFRVVGDFLDDDLGAVVDFIRTSPRIEAGPRPPTVGPTTVRGTWPIESIILRTDARIEARLLDEGPAERSGQSVILVRANGRFVVKFISEWESD